MLLPSISLHIHDYSYHSYPYCRQMCVGRCVPSLICSQCVALVPCCPGVQEHVKADAEVSLEAVRRVPELHLGRSQQITLTAGMAGCSRMQQDAGLFGNCLGFTEVFGHSVSYAQQASYSSGGCCPEISPLAASKDCDPCSFSCGLRTVPCHFFGWFPSRFHVDLGDGQLRFAH